MKICLVSDNLIGYHEKWSGAEVVVGYLTSLLEKNGQNFSRLTIKSKKEAPKNIFPLPSFSGKFWSFKRIIPLHVFIRALFAFFLLKKIKPDVIHFFHSNSLFLPVMFSAWLLRIPATFTVLDYHIICPTGHLRLKDDKICQAREGLLCKRCLSWPRLLERWLERQLIKRLKQLVTFTETSKKRLVSHGFSPEIIKVRYIYEFSFETPSAGEKIFKANDILFVGTFPKQKGLHIVVQALALVRLKIPDSRLIVIGRGEEQDKERIENLVKELNLPDAVQFLGQKKNEEVLRIVSQANLLVIAEQWFSDFGPVALVEAMAQGCPVVSGNLGSPPDFIKDGHNGFLAEYDNPESFAEKIILMLQDKKRAKEMGQRARGTIKSFFGESHNKEVFELYVAKNWLG